MSGPVRVTPRQITPPAELRLWVPGMQAVGSGVPINRAANGAVATLGGALTDAALWANAGYMTTGEQSAGSNGGFQYPAGTVDWDAANGDSILISCILRKGSLPGSEKAFLGNLSGAGSAGIQLRMGTAGDLKLGMSDGTNSATVASVSNNLCDGTDQSIQVFWDADFRKLGARTSAGFRYLSNAYLVTGSTNSANPFGVGHSGTVTSNGTLSARLANIHVYVFKAQGLPTHWRRGIERLRANPYQPINDWSAL